MRSMKKATVNPWEVKGTVDYNRLIKEFGTKPLDDTLLSKLKKHTGTLHYMLERNIFFSHRDFDWILKEYEKKNRFYLYTGRGPSGNTHVGHLVPWLLTQWLQEKFNAELWFQVTDDEKFLFNKKATIEQINKQAYDNILDIIAVGFKKGKTKIFLDTAYAGTLYKQAIRVAKKLTTSTVKAAFGLKDSNNVGELFFTSMQSVPAFLPSVLAQKNIPCLIPHAIDQDPHFRLTRDIIGKLGYPKPAALHSKFLSGLQGPETKMSSSKKETAIYMSDTPEEVEKKIKKYAFSGGRSTLKEHREKGGVPEKDTSYELLFHFCKNTKKVEEIYEQYKNGTLLSSELKALAVEEINALLKKHQERKRRAEKEIDKFIIES